MIDVENIQGREHTEESEEVSRYSDACSLDGGIFDILRRTWHVYWSTKESCILRPSQLSLADSMRNGEIPDRSRTTRLKRVGPRSLEAGNDKMRKAGKKDFKIREDQIA